MKKQIPILFSTPMVQAILAGRKTITRRIVKAELDDRGLRYCNPNTGWEDWHGNGIARPYGNPGDMLYVRENWFPAAINGNKVMIGVDPKDSTQSWEIATEDAAPYWKKLNRGCMIPSIHMPKEASRIWLEVTDIRVERLLDISEADAVAVFQLERNRNPELGGHDFDLRKEKYGWTITRLDILQEHLMVGTRGEIYWVVDVPKQHIQSANNVPLIFHYLFSKGFDLFGLIDAGLAIDAKTIHQ